MKNVLLTILAVLISLAAVAGGGYGLKVYMDKTATSSPQVIGGSQDSQGCLLAAGYSWCAQKQKCIRPWEEVCDASAPIRTLSDLIIRLKAYNKEQSGITFTTRTSTLSWQEQSGAITIAGEILTANKISQAAADKLSGFFTANGFKVDAYNISAGTVVGSVGYQKDDLVCQVIKGVSGYKEADGQWSPTGIKESDVDLKCARLQKASKDDLIKVSSPLVNEYVTSPLTITGQARGTWFFEGDFPVVLTDWDGKIIAQGYAQVAGTDTTWMTTNYVNFTAKLEFEHPQVYNRGSLILQKDNPSDLREKDDALEFTIFFK